MDGILIIDKPQGMTSHDVVDFLRKKFGIKKVGHAGTLDPMATGVLVMLMGSYTKSANTFLSEDKEYEASLKLGSTSDTGDAWGTISEEFSVVNCTDDEIHRAFRSFAGEIEQEVPMYSAVKYKGRKLYELARKGIKVSVEARKVFVKEIEVLDIAVPEVRFRLCCSKGTYVRQLAIDIGKKLGCGAHLSGLRRIRSGSFKLKDAMSMDEVKALNGEDLQKALKKT